MRDLNKLVRWLKRTPQVLVYKRLQPPVRLVAVSDSSFSAGDTQGLVMRGCVLLLVDGTGNASPGGHVQVLDWYARKQPHVCRSTFAAELHAVLDAVNQAIVVQALLTELRHGPMTATALADMQGVGKLSPPLHVCVDAKSVWDSVVADPTAVPADKHLFLHVRKMREWLDDGLIAKWWWIDTTDMLADGLTKGSVPRNALLQVAGGEVWQLRGDTALGCMPSGRSSR